MANIERCDHCERTFDETEDVFVSATGGDLCAHCAATWLGEERTRLAEQLRGAVEAFEGFVAAVAAPTGRLRLTNDPEGDPLYEAVKKARATLAMLRGR